MDVQGIPDTFDRKIHDTTRGFCANERLDEDHFRYCIRQRIRETNRMTGKLPWIIVLCCRIVKRGDRGLILLRDAAWDPQMKHERNRQSGREEAKVLADFKR